MLPWKDVFFAEEKSIFHMNFTVRANPKPQYRWSFVMKGGMTEPLDSSKYCIEVKSLLC